MASIDVNYQELLKIISPYLAPKQRTESASFLIWYLENYYRLDTLEAIDCVCDQSGDKGVDGIYVNDGLGTIDIFQSKIVQNSKSSVGDTSLKEFVGTLSQFKDAAALQNLIQSSGKTQLIRLLQTNDVINKLSTHDIRGVFVTNVDIDANGQSYLKTAPVVQFIGKQELENSYISDKRSDPIKGKATFDLSGLTSAEYIVDPQTKMLVVPIKAAELVNLVGIQDQSLFDLNVRFSLGRTQVNKDIVASIKDPSYHKTFPLFHNGITVICSELDSTSVKDKITIDDYYVVNGCQSLTHFFENQKALTSDLRVLVKFVQLDSKSDLADVITAYSNNQNGVKARDFKSNDKIQIRLMNDFIRYYKNEFYYEVKRGQLPLKGEVISNETAGLYLIAFDEKAPWTTHRKYQVFDEKYSELFGRPEVNADRIVMCHEIMKVIESHTNSIKNQLFGKYVLTKYMLLFMVRKVLESESIGAEILSNPARFVRDTQQRAIFLDCISDIVSDLVIDLNGEVEDLGDDFDYRGKLRDAEWVRKMERDVVSSHQKSVKRGKFPTLEAQLESKFKEAKAA